jgi:hypothetical protein
MLSGAFHELSWRLSISVRTCTNQFHNSVFLNSQFYTQAIIVAAGEASLVRFLKWCAMHLLGYFEIIRVFQALGYRHSIVSSTAGPVEGLRRDGEVHIKLHILFPPIIPNNVNLSSRMAEISSKQDMLECAISLRASSFKGGSSNENGCLLSHISGMERGGHVSVIFLPAAKSDVLVKENNSPLIISSNLFLITNSGNKVSIAEET